MTDEELLLWLRERGPRMISVDAKMVAAAADRIEALMLGRDVAVKTARNEIGWRKRAEARAERLEAAMIQMRDNRMAFRHAVHFRRFITAALKGADHE